MKIRDVHGPKEFEGAAYFPVLLCNDRENSARWYVLNSFIACFLFSKANETAA